jgi:hypothetical protein
LLGLLVANSATHPIINANEEYDDGEVMEECDVARYMVLDYESSGPS